MQPNPQETANLLTFTEKKKSLMENFIFCAVWFVLLIYHFHNT